MSNFKYSILLSVGVFCFGCQRPAPVPPPAERLEQPSSPTQLLKVSFYGKGDRLHGKRTANGERFDSKKLTAAHRTLPFGTLLKVTNPANQKSVVVRINDRGPYIRGRSLDLSWAAAHTLGITKQGVAELVVEEVSPD